MNPKEWTRFAAASSWKRERNMTDHEHSHHEPTTAGSFWTSRGGLVLLALLAIGGTLLLTEHRAHVLGYLPFLILLACPLLHMFMHGGHGGHGGHGARDRTVPDPRASTGTWDASDGDRS